MTQKRGWAWPDNAAKSHYFINGRSLCGRWMFLGEPLAEDHPGGLRNDCKACTQRLAKHRANQGEEVVTHQESA